MIAGDRVRFKAHGPTGLAHEVVSRAGNDVTLRCPRGRILRNVPVELLEAAD